jgi:hypothetical protein
VIACGGVSGVTGANAVYSHTVPLGDVSGGSYVCAVVTGYDGRDRVGATAFRTQ